MLAKQKNFITTSSRRDARFTDAARSSDARYAIYFAPRAGSTWWQFGSTWLGRDALTTTPTAAKGFAWHIDGALDDAFMRRVTATPRKYGFHATLKAPFRLSAGRVAQHVYFQAETLAASLRPVRLPPPRLKVIDGFVALSFELGDAATRAANSIAAQCVACFDNLRARADAAETARRHAAGLTARQSYLLAQWGYPYVFDEFRLHFTLTERLGADDQARVIDALAPSVATLGAEPFLLDALAIFMQPSVSEPLVEMRRYGFDGSLEIYGNN